MVIIHSENQNEIDMDKTETKIILYWFWAKLKEFRDLDNYFYLLLY